MRLATQVRKLRTARGLSVIQLAAMTGYSRVHIWRIETGNSRTPSLTALRRIAKALDVDVGVLVGGE